MELPVEIQLLVSAAIAFLVTQGLKSLSNLIGFDLTGASAVVTASVVGSIVVFSNAWLGTVPAELLPAVEAGFAFVLALLSAFGIHRTTKHQAVG